tara:strand:+ start:247 stop:1401 length:1155 start_codon:yes stop_codon:yes gene_type:complete
VIWEKLKLDELCTIKGRIGYRGYTKADLVEKGNGAITLSPTNIISNKLSFNKNSYISWEKYYESPEIMLEIGDIVFCKTASIGKLAFVEKLPEKTTINPQFVVLKNITCNAKFLHYYMQSTFFKAQLSKIIGGTAIPTVSQKNFGNLIIFIPPLAEQESIVAKLDAAFAKIDEAINAATAKETEVQMLKASMLSSSFNGDAVMWTNKPLGEVCEILDKLRKPITKIDRKSGVIPYYGATGVVDRVDDFIFNEKLVLVGEDGAKWKRGDKTAFIINGKAWVNNHAHVLRPYDGVLIHEWLEYYLTSIDLSPWVHGATVPKLNQTQLRSIPIPIPPLEEQERIVARLDEAFSEFKNVNEAIVKSKANYLVLKSAILAQELQSSEAA